MTWEFGVRHYPRIPRRPDLTFEKEVSTRLGQGHVAGIDEAGRGPLAGPVVAAAVVFESDGKRPRGLNDSKKLPAEKREKLFDVIQAQALAYGIGVATAQEIDLINILEATRLAALRAIAQLAVQPIGFVTDCLTIPGEARPQLPIVKGDSISASIAAASILAKVTRDRLMDVYAQEFPEYGWTENRGYPTESHYAAITEHGPTTLHRMTFRGVDFFCVEPRRSPTYTVLHESITRIQVREEIHTFRIRLSELAPRLPPPDLEDIHRLLVLHEERLP